MMRRQLAVLAGMATVLAMTLTPVPAASAADPDMLELAEFGAVDDDGRAWVGEQDTYDFASVHFSYSTRAERTLTVSGANVVLAAPLGFDDDGQEASCRVVSQTKLTCTFRAAFSGTMSFQVTAGAPGTASVTASMSGGLADTYAFAVRALSKRPVVTASAPTPGQGLIRARAMLDGEPLDYALVTATRAGVDPTTAFTDQNGFAELEFFDLPPGGATYSLHVAHGNQQYLASAPVPVTLRPAPGPTTLTMSAASSVRQGRDLRVSTRITPRPADGVVETLLLQSRAYGSSTWKTVREEWSVDGGAVTWVRLATSSQLRWVHPASFTSAAAESPTITVAVVPDSTVTASPSIAPPGSTTTLTVRTSSQGAGRSATLQEQVGGGWRDVASRTMNAQGTAGWQVRLPKAAVRTWRVRLGPTAVLPAAVTAPSKVTVTMAGAGRKSDFGFMGGTRSHPAHWSRCRPITYRVNVSQAGPGARTDVTEALRRISLYTKVKFRYLGKTKGVPRASGRQPEMLRIGWAKPGNGKGRSPSLVGGAAGVGGSWWSGTQMFRGMLVVDSRAKLPAGFGAGATRGALLLHELGHVMGLAHARTQAQIMYPVLDNDARAAVFGAGDIAGLRKLGKAGRC